MEVNNKDLSGLCPACGFEFEKFFGFKPWDDESPSDELCPSCNIQFGYTDAAGGDWGRRKLLYQTWRKKWISDGMPWRAPGHPKPNNWNPSEQVRPVSEL